MWSARRPRSRPEPVRNRNQRIVELAALGYTSKTIAAQLLVEGGITWELKPPAVRKIHERERRRITAQRQISVTQETFVAA